MDNPGYIFDSDLILKLQDGGIVDIKDDMYHFDGCPTCDYGSEYITELDITFTQYKLHIEINNMYNFGVTQGDVMRIILKNVDKILNMTEFGFCEWLCNEFKKLNLDNFKKELTELWHA